MKMIDLDRDQVVLRDVKNFARLKSIENPAQEEISLHAASVRQLLLDGLLGASAASRNVGILFHVNDSNPLVRAARNGKAEAFQLAGVTVFGISIAGGVISRGPVAAAEDFDPGSVVSLKLDSFLKQTVAFIGGQFLTRYDILIYVANKAGGVHYDPTASKALPNEKMRALGMLRRSFAIGTADGATNIRFTPSADEEQSSHFRYEPTHIDAVYLEFLAIITAIEESIEVKALVDAIVSDLH
jgi:hypothetical protein